MEQSRARKLKSLLVNIRLLLATCICLYLLIEIPAVIYFHFEPAIIRLSGRIISIPGADKRKLLKNNCQLALHYQLDPLLGMTNPASEKFASSCFREDGTEIFSIEVSYDKHARRTVNQATIEPRDSLKRPFLLFGDSFSFSFGLADKETLQYQLAEVFPQLEVFSYAVPGWGPHQSLALLESRNLASEADLKQEIPVPGDAIYFHGDQQISRIAGSLNASWLYSSPYYQMEAGRVVSRGSFLSARPVITKLYMGINQLRKYSHFLQLLPLEHPATCSDDLRHLLSRIYAKMRQEFRRQFSGELYLAFHPLGNLCGEQYRKNLIAELERLEIPTVSAPELDGDINSYTLEDDGHPNGKLNRELAEYIGLTQIVS